MAQLNFDATNVAPQVSIDPIPDGWYNLKIVESEIKPTKNNDGCYLSLTAEVLDGAYVGRKVFDRLNLQNPNPTAVEIGQRRLSAYCHATGVIRVADSTALHGIPFKAKVAVVTDKTGQYDPRNEIKAIKHINDQTGQPAAPGGFQAPAQPMPSQYANTPPPPQFQAPAQPAFAPQGQPAFQAPAQQAFQAPQAAPGFAPPQPPAGPPQNAAPAGATPPWMRQG